MKRERQEYSCAFCGKPREAVRRLIVGPGRVCICNDCVAVCNEIIAGEEEHIPPASPEPSREWTEGCRAIPWWRRLLGWQQ
jgi:hypothetical protein